MSSLSYVQMSGTGNTFLLLDLSSKKKEEELKKLFPHKNFSQITQSLCQKKESDGMVFLLESSPSSQVDFLWDFYNKDGSSAEMCGNAACSVAYFAYIYKYKKGKIQLSFQRPDSKAVVKTFIRGDSDVEVQIEAFHLKLWNEELVLHSNQKSFPFLNSMTYHLIHSGVPHVVMEYKNKCEEKELLELSVLLRKEKRFSHQKVNLTYYRPLKSQPQKIFGQRMRPDSFLERRKEPLTEKRALIEAISFERGVEAFTRACGTGAVACAYAFYKKNPSYPIVSVYMPGGVLEVNLNNKKPLLRGKVSFLEEGRLSDLENQ